MTFFFGFGTDARCLFFATTQQTHDQMHISDDPKDGRATTQQTRDDTARHDSAQRDAAHHSRASQVQGIGAKSLENPLWKCAQRKRDKSTRQLFIERSMQLREAGITALQMQKDSALTTRVACLKQKGPNSGDDVFVGPQVCPATREMRVEEIMGHRFSLQIVHVCRYVDVLYRRTCPVMSSSFPILENKLCPFIHIITVLPWRVWTSRMWIKCRSS